LAIFYIPSSQPWNEKSLLFFLEILQRLKKLLDTVVPPIKVPWNGAPAPVTLGITAPASVDHSMDPLSITAACITLVTTVSKVSIQINGFVREVRDARGDLDAISRELISLKTVLEILSEDAENSTGGGFPQSLVRQISGILTNCGGVLEQIEASLQKHAGGGVKRGVKWSLSGRDDVNKLRSSLEAHKSALDIALDMVALYVSLYRHQDQIIQLIYTARTMTREIKADTEELRNDTAAIKDNTTQILAEIARLQARLPQDDRIWGGAGFTLQRYLDNLSSYAETPCDLSDEESDSGVDVETHLSVLSEEERLEPHPRDESGSYSPTASGRHKSSLGIEEDLDLKRQVMLQTVREKTSERGFESLNGRTPSPYAPPIPTSYFLPDAEVFHHENRTSTSEDAIIPMSHDFLDAEVESFHHENRTSNVHAEERGPGHLVKYEAPDKGHDQTEETTKAKNGKGMVIKVKSTSKIAVVETSRVGHRDRVLGEDDIATILPPPSNTLQVPNLNRSTNGAEQEGRILTHSYTVQSYIAQNEIAAQLLLQNGFDVKQKDFSKEKALHWAAFNGHEAVVQLLLEKGADIEAKSNDGWTALRWAAFNGHKAVVQLLLEKGADIEAKDNDGWTALYGAASSGREAVVQLLLEKGADIESNKGWTALHVAASGGHEAVLQLLLEKGADIEAKDNDGWTALHVAASNGHKAVVQLLLEKGANIEAKSNNGRTALHVAASNKHREKSKDGGTVRRRVASNKREAVVQLLLEKGADIETKDNDGWTALHVAASSGHKAVLQLLLEKGADIEAKSNDGWTALHVAASSGHEAVVQLLKQARPSLYQRLKLSLRRGQG
jgi:ankyrin repeat protein